MRVCRYRNCLAHASIEENYMPLTNAGKDAYATAVQPIYQACKLKYKDGSNNIVATVENTQWAVDLTNHRLKITGNYTASVTSACTITSVDFETSAANGGAVVRTATFGLSTDTPTPEIIGTDKTFGAGSLISVTEDQVHVTAT